MLIVIATKEELSIVEELGYRNTPILITGVGGVNVINALQNIPKDTYIINIGYAGSNNLKIGTIVEATCCGTYHENVEFYEKNVTTCGNIDCYTSTDFVLKTKIKDTCVFDMELAFIKAMGFTNVKSYKKISDNLNIEEYEREKEKQND